MNPADSTVIAVSHGRDGLHEGWPAFFSEAEAAEAAGEEMIRVASSRADFGWPYCYYDYLKDERKLAPEYGGDGRSTERCDHMIQPLVTFPAHWSPMSILFYTGTMFPAEYKGGAFIAFHGSSFRRPMPEDGYEVIFLHFKNGQATTYTPFATGFAGGTLSPTAPPPRGRPRPRARRRPVPHGRQGRAYLENRLSEVIPVWRGKSRVPVLAITIGTRKQTGKNGHKRDRKCFGNCTSLGSRLRRESPPRGSSQSLSSVCFSLCTVCVRVPIVDARLAATREKGPSDGGRKLERR